MKFLYHLYVFLFLTIYSQLAAGWSDCEEYLYKGTIYNNLLCYNEAIECLDKAIDADSKNLVAYIERATAYFELGYLELAIRDYKIIKELTIKPPFTSFIILNKNCNLTEKIDFAKGLVNGIRVGSSEACVDYIPTVFGCLTGLLKGTWAFVCEPREVTQDLREAAYKMGQVLADWGAYELLEHLVPEIQECAVNWNNWSEYGKGYSFGYIVGKYGIDIFMPFAGAKVLRKFRYLKRSNTLMTLEQCMSPTKKKTIEISTLEHAKSRKILLAYAKQGKILPQNPNVVHHVMQKKHAWEQVVPLSGNKTLDFKKVAECLEKSNLLDKKNFIRVNQEGQAFFYVYETKVNGKVVRAFLDKDKASSALLLKDAYVVTR